MFLQKIYAFASKKSKTFYKKYFFEKVRDLINKNLEKLKVILAKNIIKKKLEIIYQNFAIYNNKKRLIKKIFI